MPCNVCCHVYKILTKPQAWSVVTRYFMSWLSSRRHVTHYYYIDRFFFFISSFFLRLGYGPGGRCSIPGGRGGFFIHHLRPAGPGARPVPVPRVPGGPSPRVTCGRAVMLTTHPPPRAEVQKEWRYASSPPKRLLA
jgi:hypothetical protein